MMIYQLFTYLKTLSKSEKGQGAVEYALIIAVVSIVLVLALQGMDGPLGDLITRISNLISTSGVGE